jgi:hypothetical protein
LRGPFGLALLLATTALVFAPGLSGPLILDDASNLREFQAWLAGRTSWIEVVLGNGSGPTGRPLAMLSFVLSGLIAGDSVSALKSANVLLHLANGALVFAIVRRLRVHGANERTALIAAALWLLNPMHASTVLYVVQRMALLSAFFVLLSVVAYLWATAESVRRPATSAVVLFGVVPVLFICAVMSKENGVCAPLLCAAIETLRRPWRDRRLLVFHALFALLPLLAAVTFLPTHLDRFMEPYWIREFSPAERLLTQLRALWSYVGAFLLPGTNRLGIYSDAYAASRTLLDPPTTAIALVAWLASGIAAWLSRRTMPLATLGLLWYASAHALEASFLPLEHYFEHRNYLPSVGIVFVVIAAGTRILEHLGMSRLRAAVVPALLAVTMAFGLATAARAWVWQDARAIVESSLARGNDSLRARLDLVAILVGEGRHAEALAIVAPMTASPRRTVRALASLTGIGIACVRDGLADGDRLAALDEHVGYPVYYAHVAGVEGLADLVEAGCTGIDRVDFADRIVRLVDAAPQPPDLVTHWKLRYVAAQLYADGGAPKHAHAQALKAWASGRAAPVGGYAVQLAAVLGHCNEARTLLADVSSVVKVWQLESRRQIHGLGVVVEHCGSATGVGPPGGQGPRS